MTGITVKTSEPPRKEHINVVLFYRDQMWRAVKRHVSTWIYSCTVPTYVQTTECRDTLYFLLDSNCAIALSEILVLFGIRIIK
jgi:hypothetical protein